MTLDTESAAKYLFCSESRVTELVACGKLRGCKIGRGLVFKQNWLDDFLEAESKLQMGRASVESKAPISTPAQRKHGCRRNQVPDLSKYEAALSSSP